MIAPSLLGVVLVLGGTFVVSEPAAHRVFRDGSRFIGLACIVAGLALIGLTYLFVPNTES